MQNYPEVFDEKQVGEYPALAKAGGGFVWDEVLEYRVWCHPERGAEDLENRDDYFYCFKSYNEAKQFSLTHKGVEEPIALVLQREYIDEPEPGKYIHIKEERITEWPVEFLSRPRRDENTIPSFFAPNAPRNRLNILRGIDEAEISVENIYISEVNEQINTALVIDGDEHSVWAYLLDLVNNEQEVILAGFICSKGTIVNSSEEVEKFLSKEFQPPLMYEYENEFSIQKTISNKDFNITWDLESHMIKVSLKKDLYLIIDLKNHISFSKSISKRGPYGNLISEYIIE